MTDVLSYYSPCVEQRLLGLDKETQALIKEILQKRQEEQLVAFQNALRQEATQKNELLKKLFELKEEQEKFKKLEGHVQKLSNVIEPDCPEFDDAVAELKRRQQMQGVKVFGIIQLINFILLLLEVIPGLKPVITEIRKVLNDDSGLLSLDQLIPFVQAEFMKPSDGMTGQP